MTMMPGSNPLFGLNTLGGALAVQTKDGRSSPGTSVQAIGGAYGRRAIEFEHGRQAKNGVDWYLAASLFHDDGWRPLSASDVRQVFAKIGWRDPKTEVHVTGAVHGQQAQRQRTQEVRLCVRLHERLHHARYDDQPATSVNVTARHSLTPQSGVSLNAYFRNIRTATVNGDVNEESLDQDACDGGRWRSAQHAVSRHTLPAAGGRA